MGDERKMTLKEVLDAMNIKSGDDHGFVVINGRENTVMEVSRRYLESPSFSDILDKKVSYITDYNAMCGLTYAFVLE